MLLVSYVAVSVPVPLLAFGGTSLLAFMEAWRFITSAWAGHASTAAIAQANPAKADRKIVGCIALSSLIGLSRFVKHRDLASNPLFIKGPLPRHRLVAPRRR